VSGPLGALIVLELSLGRLDDSGTSLFRDEPEIPSALTAERPKVAVPVYDRCPLGAEDAGFATTGVGRLGGGDGLRWIVV
jgi:hypothetical protein